MIEATKYTRKPFEVDAIRVTEENMEDVANWAQGEIRTAKAKDTEPGGKYIQVRVHRPLTDRQTRAFVGDWVLYAGTGYKVYTNKAFQKSFDPIDGESHEVSRDAGTGRFVSHEDAEERPDETVTENVS